MPFAINLAKYINPTLGEKIYLFEHLQTQFSNTQSSLHLKSHSISEITDSLIHNSLLPLTEVQISDNIQDQIFQLKKAIQNDLENEFISALFEQNHEKISSILVSSEYFSFSASLQSNHLEGSNLLSRIHRMGDWETIISIIEANQCSSEDLLNFKLDDGKSLLLSAIQEQRSDIALKIIQSDIFPDELLLLSNDPKMTPLSCAMALNQTEVVTSLQYAISLNHQFLLERFTQYPNLDPQDLLKDFSSNDDEQKKLKIHLFTLWNRLLKRQLFTAEEQYIFSRGILHIFIASSDFYYIELILNKKNFPLQLLLETFEFTENLQKASLNKLIYSHIKQLNDEALQILLNHSSLYTSKRLTQIALTHQHDHILLNILERDDCQSEHLRIQDDSGNNALIYLLKNFPDKRDYYDVLMKLILNVQICPIDILLLENNFNESLFSLALFLKKRFFLIALDNRPDFSLNIQEDSFESMQMSFLEKALPEKHSLKASTHIQHINITRYTPENIFKLFHSSIAHQQYNFACTLVKKLNQCAQPPLRALALLQEKISNGNTFLMLLLEQEMTLLLENVTNQLSDQTLSILLKIPNDHGETLLIKAIQNQNAFTSTFATRIILSATSPHEMLIAKTNQEITAFDLAKKFQDHAVLEAFSQREANQENKMDTEELAHKINNLDLNTLSSIEAPDLDSMHSIHIRKRSRTDRKARKKIRLNT